MAAPSKLLPLGTKMPSFALTDARTGALVESEAFAMGSPLVVMFVCNHCPYVVHVRDELTRLCREYAARGVASLAINSNSVVTHPQDGPTHMRALAESLGWQFPFLFDETQDVARAFGAACTPELYVFDAGRRLVYHGQLDDSRPQNGKPVTGRDLRAALEALLAGRPPLPEQKPSQGCSIKWQPSREHQG